MPIRSAGLVLGIGDALDTRAPASPAYAARTRDWTLADCNPTAGCRRLPTTTDSACAGASATRNRPGRNARRRVARSGRVNLAAALSPTCRATCKCHSAAWCAAAARCAVDLQWWCLVLSPLPPRPALQLGPVPLTRERRRRGAQVDVVFAQGLLRARRALALVRRLLAQVLRAAGSARGQSAHAAHEAELHAPPQEADGGRVQLGQRLTAAAGREDDQWDVGAARLLVKIFVSQRRCTLSSAMLVRLGSSAIVNRTRRIGRLAP